MGSCFSTCRPQKPSQDHHQDLYNLDHVLVQDKLVMIKEAPKTISPSPSSPSHSCSTTITTSSSCSSSCSSSSLSSASSSSSRTFSNEFLWTCIKENPHIIRASPIRENSVLSSPANLVQVLAPPAKQSMNLQRATPQKRVRSSSPNNSSAIARQKSFRREQAVDDHLHHSKLLRSPSPSRRFNGDKSMRAGSVKSNMSARSNNCKENLSSNSSSGRVLGRPGLRNREGVGLALALSKNVGGSRFDEACSVLDEDTPMEDLDNPLISLDCFIFL